MTERALFIGKVAQHAKVNPGTIRYYEAIGLLPKPQRGQNRYRVYSADAVEMLQFIRKAQGLGLRLSEIQELVEVRRTGREPCGHMQALAERKIDDLDWKLEELATLRKNLKDLLSRSKRQRAQGYEMASSAPISKDFLLRRGHENKHGGVLACLAKIGVRPSFCAQHGG